MNTIILEGGRRILPNERIEITTMNNTETLVEEALRKYKSAKRIAVENFCFSAPDDKVVNSMNLNEDARMYGWNTHTKGAIRTVLRAENKI